jgi:hypothetical protein
LLSEVDETHPSFPDRLEDLVRANTGGWNGSGDWSRER